MYNTIMLTQSKPTPDTYNEWQRAYDLFNELLFKGELPSCLITLQREKNTMGYFSFNRFANHQGMKTDEIALNPAFFAVMGMREALSTLVHEMVHLWQYHFGDPGRGRYHNKEWGSKMESIGLMPSHTGSPGGKKTGDRMNDYIIDGGIFERSINTLVEAGFELKWMDRVVVQPKNIHINRPLDNNDIMSLAASIGLDQALAEAIDVDFTRIMQPKQGNRSKYSCKTCDVNLWGKPGLNISCGECHETFTEQ